MSHAGGPGGRTRIKICGVRDAATAAHCCACGADAIGLVRVAGSPREVDAQSALSIASLLPPWVAAVAVFADVDGESILGEWPHDWVQLHGREVEIDPLLGGRAIVKAIPATLSDEAILWWDAHPRVRALLVDAPHPGAGVPFDHGRLRGLRERLSKPLLLAGGLTPANVGEAIALLRPWAVDVSSGVERSRGEKSAELISAFCDAVRAADAALGSG